MQEQELIQYIRQQIPTTRRLKRGIGDDAAVLRTNHSDLVVTVDLLTDGVDFISKEISPEWIGRKAMAVNLSDLAAMAAIPHSAVIAVALPQKNGGSIAQRLFDGMLRIAQEFDLAIAGGDTNSWKEKLAISITAFGRVSPFGSTLRSGARVGDRILSTGRFGGSLLRRQFLFTPRVHEALWLNEHAKIHAAIDVSDGLLLDLCRLADESRLGFQIEESAIPIHPDVDDYRAILQGNNHRELCPSAQLRRMIRTKFSSVKNWDRFALDRALYDGEDFELLLAVPPKDAARLLYEQPFMKEGVPLTDIGYFHEYDKGRIRRTSKGKLETVKDHLGFLHTFNQEK